MGNLTRERERERERERDRRDLDAIIGTYSGPHLVHNIVRTCFSCLACLRLMDAMNKDNSITMYNTVNKNKYVAYVTIEIKRAAKLPGSCEFRGYNKC